MLTNIIFIILLLCAIWLAYKMSVADLSRRIIPDVYLFPFMLIGFIVVSGFTWVSSSLESAIAGGFGYLLGTIVGYIFTKTKLARKSDEYSPIGMGDLKLMAAGGIWLGTTGLAIAIIISCAIGGIWGIRKKQKYIPFAPFFFIGAICALITLWFLI